MLTVTLVPNSQNLYIDGVLEATDNVSNIVGFNINQADIGYEVGGTAYYFSGKMDNYRIYNRALTQAEITLIYNGEK